MRACVRARVCGGGVHLFILRHSHFLFPPLQRALYAPCITSTLRHTFTVRSGLYIEQIIGQVSLIMDLKYLAVMAVLTVATYSPFSQGRLRWMSLDIIHVFGY